jgi:hypothetical protein
VAKQKTLVSCRSGSGEGRMGYFIHREFPASVAVCAVALFATAVFARPMYSQSAPPPIHVGGVELTGIPEDWSSHYVVFSNPGTEQEAIQSGRHEQWLRTVNDPRYVMQQLRRHLPVQGPAAADVANRLRWDAEAARSGDAAAAEDFSADPFSPIRIRRRLIPERMPQPELKRDWNMPLGGPGLAAGHFPAKYGFFPTSASCTDYAVFPTGAAGSTTQPTIVAFTNLYVGTGGCEATDPTVYWAYEFPAATVNLSPVLSIDGTQVAFIQVSTSNQAILTIVRMAPGGTLSSPVLPTGEPAASYPGCTAPCYTAIPLSGSPNDTNSAPFYVYGGSDTLYVGDNSGRLHQFTNVFNGTPTNPPTETTTNGWPVTLTTTTPAVTATALTSPVYDPVSGLVFVGNAGGFLLSVTTTGTPAVTAANRSVCGTAGFVDSPVLDSTTSFVYVFSGDGCDVTPGNSYVNRFATGTSIYAANFYGANYMSMGNASTPTSVSTNMFRGAFDNIYFTGTGTTGNLYVCVQGVVFQLPMATLTTSGGNTPAIGTRFSTPLSTAPSDTSACSPVTEFLGATADWLFLSVKGNGSAPGCTGPCIMNFDITSGAAAGTPTAGLTATGGSSGIIIDNRSTTQVGAGQVYFTMLGSTTATQASQAGLQ